MHEGYILNWIEDKMADNEIEIISNSVKSASIDRIDDEKIYFGKINPNKDGKDCTEWQYMRITLEFSSY